MDKKLLIGSATRYIAGRHAVQTVYWRKSGDGLLKTTRTCNFGKPEKGIDSAKMFANVRERYSTS